MRRISCMLVILLIVSMFSQVSRPYNDVEEPTDSPPMEVNQSPVTFTDVAVSSGFGTDVYAFSELITYGTTIEGNYIDTQGRNEYPTVKYHKIQEEDGPGAIQYTLEAEYVFIFPVDPEINVNLYIDANYSDADGEKVSIWTWNYDSSNFVDTGYDVPYPEGSISISLSGEFVSPTGEVKVQYRDDDPDESLFKGLLAIDFQAIYGKGGTFFAWGDYDSDGDEDLLVNGGRLYRNNLVETGIPDFTDVTSEAGLSGGGNGVWGDYDNDGCLDFYANRLWRSNCDGTFTDVTVAAGNIKINWPYGAAGWGDYDRDGYLDLYAAGAEGPFGVYHPDILWHSNGNGTFSDVSAKAFGNGVTWIEQVMPKYGRGIEWADYNNDGWLDLYVTNYRQQDNYLWENDQDGTFSTVGFLKGVHNGVQNLTNNPDPCNRPGHGVGSAWGDYDNDGDLDLYVGNLNHKDWRTSDDSLLYRNNGPGAGYSFTNVRGEAGMSIKPYDLLGPNLDGDCSGSPTVFIWTGPQGDELIMEGVWSDYDNDGWLDLFVPQIYDTSYSYAYLYHNNQNGTFAEVATSAGVHDVYDTYGGAWADYDNDGDMDLVTGGKRFGGKGTLGNIKLFRNNMELNNSWLKVKLVGCGSNTCAIGARVNVTNGTLIQIREVEGGTGAHSQQNSMVLNFGFGNYYGEVNVTVRWPNGIVSSFNSTLNQTLYKVETNCTSPPTNPKASFFGTGNNDLNITWTLSADDGAGLDNVANYAIYYSDTYDRNGMLYTFLTEVPKGTNYYVHPMKGINDTTSHFYLVKANSTLGYQVWSDDQGAKTSQFLSQGQNLVSIPIVVNDNDIATVLQTLNYSVAWFYDPLDMLDPWKSYNPLKSYNDLSSINHTMGIWIDIVSDSYLITAGMVPVTTDIELKAGWNLVGYPSFKGKAVAKVLSSVPYERVEGFDASSVPEKLSLYGDSDVLSTGYGFWVKLSSDASLTITQI